MPLTPEDVSNKRFTPVRLREGYDMGEVDQFLDEVEAELARLTQENDDLRARLSAAQAGAPVSPMTSMAPSAPQAPADEAAPTAEQAAPTDFEPRVETVRVETIAQASAAATRLLELATRNADELVDEARAEADRILGEARTEAERREAEAKAEADRVESDARSRAQLLDAETSERREQVIGDLERERHRLDAEIEDLRSFEREYRSRLRTYFTQQLDALDNAEDLAPPTGDQLPAPKRLRSVLGDDQG